MPDNLIDKERDGIDALKRVRRRTSGPSTMPVVDRVASGVVTAVPPIMVGDRHVVRLDRQPA